MTGPERLASKASYARVAGGRTGWWRGDGGQDGGGEGLVISGEAAVVAVPGEAPLEHSAPLDHLKADGAGIAPAPSRRSG